MPAHGEYRHLKKHADLAESMGMPKENIFILANGQSLEFTKDKVWEEDYRMLDDQLYIIAKQFHRISRLIDKVDVVIMDTSLLSSIIYDKSGSQALKEFCIEMFNQFNNMVFFIDRSDIKYHTEGRVETLERSQEIDDNYKKLMEECNIPYVSVNNDECVDVIVNKLKEEGYI